MRESGQVVRVEKRRIDEISLLTVERADSARIPRPLVFVVHGVRGRKERFVGDLCLGLAEAGFLACALDARFHGERASARSAALADRMHPDFAAAFAETLLGTVQDLGTVADHLGHARYGVIGYSMGGYIALKAAVTDPRAAVVVSAAGSPDWTPADAAPPAELTAWAARESPLTHAEAFFPRPLLLLHGDADTTVLIDGARSLHACLKDRYEGDPACLSLVEYPGHGHDFTLEMAQSAVAWIQRFRHALSGSAASG